VSFSLGRALTFTAVSAICVTAAGCGGDPLAGLTAKQVLSKAVSDLKSAPSFHLGGTADEQGQSISLDLTYKHGTGCEGTLGLHGKGSIYLLVIGGTAWFKPDQTYWESNAGSSAPSVIAAVGSKYLRASTSGSVSGLAQLCNANSLASSFTSPRDIAKGGTSTINGQQALALKDPAKSSTLYVTDTSSPQVLRLTSTQSGSNGRIDFTGYGNSVTLTPPASETIDGAPYGF
jgi:hypothetical protein